MFEGQILQFPLYLCQSKAMSKWCIDIEGFLCEPEAFLRRKILECAHIMKSVCKFHKHDTDIAHHGKQQLAIAFSLRYFMAFKDVRNFCNTVNNICNCIAEFCPNIF